MKPFLDGKKNAGRISLTAPAPGAAAVALTPRRGPSPSAPSPTIEAVKEGDKIIRLVITCACGERMEVECLYPPGV